MAAMEQPQQAAQGQREFPAAGREDVFQRALVGFAPGAQLGVGLMQLGEILLQGLDSLLLVSRSLFQLVEVLLLADGDLRKLDNPKRKKKQHVAPTTTVLENELLKSDQQLRDAIRAYDAAQN